MNPTKDAPVAVKHVFNASHIGRDTRHGYTSFVNVLPEYFAGKYWRFYLSSDEVREPRRIDPHKEAISFFIMAPEISTRNRADVSLSLQRFVSILEPQWYDAESDKIRES